MLYSLNVRTTSITEAKRDFSKIIRETEETGEPTFIFNHNKPEAVLISHEAYEYFVNKYKEMEEKLFFSGLENRIEKGPGRLVAAEDVVDMDLSRNAFAHLTAEDLFD